MVKNRLILFGILLLFAPSLNADYLFNRLAKIPGISTAFDYILAGDTDHNGLNELIFRTYEKATKQWTLAFFEYRPNNKYELVYAETLVTTNWFYPGGLADVDKDSLIELVGGGVDYTANPMVYKVQTRESPTYHDYPTKINWEAKLEEPNPMPICLLNDFDQDGKNEIWTKVSDTAGWIYNEIYENDHRDHNILVLSKNIGSASGKPLPCDDFDGDGKKEFATWGWLTTPVGYRSEVAVFENTVNNDYQKIWSDTTYPLKNGHDLCAGHDYNGKPVFFISFDQPVGMYQFMNYLVEYQAVGINSYQKVLVDSALHGGMWLTRQSTCGDIDGDGKQEVVWSLGDRVMVLKAVGSGQYQRVWNWFNSLGGDGQSCRALCYDLNKNGYDEIILTGNYKTEIWEIEPGSIFEARTNFGKPFVSHLYPNYPNPFSSQTTIKYQIAGGATEANLRIFDAAGRLVKDLARAQSPESRIQTILWDGRDERGRKLPTGVYFVELTVGHNSRLDRFCAKVVFTH